MNRRHRKDMGKPPDTANGAPVLDGLRERIRRRAYELYERRGAEHGHDEEDWLEAERQVKAEPDARGEGHD